MCCSVTMPAPDKELALSLLGRGGFNVERDGLYVRDIPEEGAYVYAWFSGGGLHLGLSPLVRRAADHEGMRTAASIMFELAVRYAEKAHVPITQLNNVSGCTPPRQRLLGHYPGQPFTWKSLCPGFRRVFLGSGVL